MHILAIYFAQMKRKSYLASISPVMFEESQMKLISQRSQYS